MNRNALLTTAVLFCLATSALAGDKKQNAQPQSQETRQTQRAGSDADTSVDHTASTKSDCPEKKHSKRKHQQSEPERDSQVPQNQVEYGGGG